MSSKRFYVDKTTYDHGAKKTQVGGGSKTHSQAQELKARMRAIDAKRYGSASYSINEDRRK
jgi:hypothetical protein